MQPAKWTPWLRQLAALLSVGFVAALFVLFALRVGHPYLLEWQEGAMVDQVVRILAGQPLYAEPEIGFVAQIYAPLYFYVSAALSAVFGIGFVPLRVISIASTIACLACMAIFVWRETGCRVAVASTLGLFAAAYPVSAAFLDIGRVDALFLCMSMAGVVVVRGAKSPAGMLAAALLFALAFATKQQGLLFAVAMGAWVFFAHGVRLGSVFAVSFAAMAGGYLALLSWATSGWSGFYLYGLPGSHEIFWPMLWMFWWIDLAKPMALACGIAFAWLVALARAREWGDLVFWLMLLGVCTGSALGSRMHWGGATNVVLPAYMGIALAFGVALGRLRETARLGENAAAMLAALALVQLAWLVYDPRPLVPQDLDRRSGEAFVEALGNLEGDVLASWHGHLPTLAGKRVFAHRSAVHDVMRSDRMDEAGRLQADYEAALASHRFGAVVVDQPYFLRDYERAPLERHYRHVGEMLEDGLEIGGLLGYRANPHLYLPREASGPGPGASESSTAGEADTLRR